MLYQYSQHPLGSLARCRRNLCRHSLCPENCRLGIPSKFVAILLQRPLQLSTPTPSVAVTDGIAPLCDNFLVAVFLWRLSFVIAFPIGYFRAVPFAPCRYGGRVYTGDNRREAHRERTRRFSRFFQLDMPGCKYSKCLRVSRTLKPRR